MRYRNRVVFLLFMLSIITYLDRVAIGLASGRIQADLHISPERWRLVLGVFALSYAAFEIPTGSMGDRLGRRRILTRIVVWWSVFTTVTGFASNFPPLLISRFLFGAGEPALIQIARPVFHAGFPGRSVGGRTASSGWQAVSAALLPPGWLFLFSKPTAGAPLSFFWG